MNTDRICKLLNIEPIESIFTPINEVESDEYDIYPDLEKLNNFLRLQSIIIKNLDFPSKQKYINDSLHSIKQYLCKCPENTLEDLKQQILQIKWE